jgi:ketosteroid isomerase-like protein
MFRRLPCFALALAVAATGLPVLAHAQPQDATSAPYQAPGGAPVSSDDAWAILDIIARMNGAIDTEDYALYASYYTDDGVIDSGFGPPVRGHEAIRQSLEASAPFITNKRHAAANVVLNRDGERLVATYYLTVFERRSALAVAGTALIVDAFEREGGVWKVASHTTRMDPATLAAMQGSGR